MLVDDDTDLLSLLETILIEEGLDVVTAHNGQEALDILETQKAPWLILSDISMPVMNGQELCIRLKTKNSTKDIPFILSSALPESIERSEGVGASAFLLKPYDLEKLVNLVKTHLN